MPEAPATKICTKCQTEKPINEFGILKSSFDGHNPLCFDCKRKRDQNSRTKKAKRTKVRDRRPRTKKPKSAESPEKKIIDQHKESAEDHLIKAFKKTTIKSFIRDDLIPMLERIVDGKFE